MYRYITAFLLFLLIASCRPAVFAPKPQGYFRVDTPDVHQYRLFDRPGFPYTFEYPVYSTIQNDTVFKGGKADNTYWINVVFPGFGGVINLTYKEINADHLLSKLVEDSWGLSFMHHEKTLGLHEQELSEPGKGVLLYVLDGNTASRYQFTVTDSVKHFLHGSLYFDVAPNADSLKPVTDFLEQDIKHMLITLKWR